MSVRVMTAVFERYPNGGGEMLLALALADHASDDGSRVFPKVKDLAIKTRQSERAVQYQLRRMEETGWLTLVGYGNGGRSMAREYQISQDWINGAEIAPMQKGANDDSKGCKTEHERVQPIAPANNRHKSSINHQSVQRAQAPAPASPRKVRSKPKPPLDETALQAACRATWEAYSTAYATRYGTAPLRNAKVNSAIKGFVQRVGHDEAPAVAGFFVDRVADPMVVRRMHDTGLLLANAEAYRTQWVTGRTPMPAPPQGHNKHNAAAKAIFDDGFPAY